MEWKSIESAPRDGTKVLISDGEDIWLAAWADYGEDASGFSECGTDAPLMSIEQLDECTHWMPLPTLPGAPNEKRLAAAEAAMEYVRTAPQSELEWTPRKAQ